MPRPIKDPKKKIETTVNQLLTKLKTLKRMAELGHLKGDYYEKIDLVICKGTNKLAKAVEDYADPIKEKPFKLNGK